MHKKGQFIVKRAAPEEGVKIWETQAGTFREEIILEGSRKMFYIQRRLAPACDK